MSLVHVFFKLDSNEDVEQNQAILNLFNIAPIKKQPKMALQKYS